MKRFSEQLKKKSESIRLSTSERADLRDRLVSYMEYHPLPVQMQNVVKTTKRKETGITSSPFVIWKLNSVYFKTIIPTLALIAVVAVPTLAQQAAPGDVLYPVKIRFNEEVVSSLAFSPYEQIEWETQRLERRIAEARLLANEGKLTSDVEAGVAAAIVEQSQKTKERIAELRETDADEAAIAEIAFASMLSVQNDVFEKDVINQKKSEVGGNSDESNQSGLVLANIVAAESSAATLSQAASTPSYERLFARLETETTYAYELFGSVRKVATTAELADIERRLEDIERKMTEANVMVNGSIIAQEAVVASSSDATASTSLVQAEDSDSEVDKKAATELLRTAMADIRKLVSFMSNIDVRETVSVEEIVPLTPTETERRASLTDGMRALVTLVDTVQRFQVPFDQESSIKFITGVEQLRTLQNDVTEAYSQEKLQQTEQKLTHATELATDLIRIAQAQGFPVLEQVQTAPERQDIAAASAGSSTLEVVPAVDTEAEVASSTDGDNE